MFGSNPWRALWALTLVMASGVALAQSADRDQEQIKRLRQQIRQLQQQHTAALQAATVGAASTKAADEQALAQARADSTGQRQAANAAQRRATALASDLASAQDGNQRLKAEVADLTAQLNNAQQAAQQAQARHQQEQTTQLARHEALLGTQAQCQRRNGELHALGMALLTRYEQKSVADVLAGHEPFVQSARVRLENEQAAYQDQLDAARLRPAPVAP